MHKPIDNDLNIKYNNGMQKAMILSCDMDFHVYEVAVDKVI